MILSVERRFICITRHYLQNIFGLLAHCSLRDWLFLLSAAVIIFVTLVWHEGALLWGSLVAALGVYAPSCGNRACGKLLKAGTLLLKKINR
ncbi:MAG: hypothetical protein A2928_03735 [Candidatus Taylorbacteria bacterium RIFCSPLOWO2_01_FULL_45_15b]|uniref:Uncharacterized protein n=1 Tax=Candidatus Taylorbacteria bacterium RIFCSPLOWO2_01_FULL_45_15b TaxID=1802319 RepID=A0A1G2NF69_9BACT|nr:MAG: hypothetical protein A2928_03735 [Candidatus Taylorbacteria bacterium RIFCSPLOWO2_01_FULL_45_15b]